MNQLGDRNAICTKPFPLGDRSDFFLQIRIRKRGKKERKKETKKRERKRKRKIKRRERERETYVSRG